MSFQVLWCIRHLVGRYLVLKDTDDVCEVAVLLWTTLPILLMMACQPKALSYCTTVVQQCNTTIQQLYLLVSSSVSSGGTWLEGERGEGLQTEKHFQIPYLVPRIICVRITFTWMGYVIINICLEKN